MGGVRTALYNFLYARNQNGSFILRIEDTDRNRYVEGAEEYIINSLRWCGLNYDEGAGKGGNYGPYRQSERKELYRRFAEQMVQEGNAYYAFDTERELEELRERLKLQKSDIQHYNALTRGDMKNSLTLSEKEVKALIDRGNSYVIRFKMPEERQIAVTDLIRGKVEVNSGRLDDKILFKSDGMPTYHLANVVDDHEMKISHVIRGEEWLPSLPLHVLLYEALGWKNEMPVFAHLPLILKPNGKGKLSKRDGEKVGFPVFPLRWTDPKTGEVYPGSEDSGYLPEAYLNILAFLGWNPGTERELYAIDDMIKSFDLEKVGKAGSRFDPDKARWFNHQYLMKKPGEELAELFMPVLKERGCKPPIDYVAKVCSLVKKRINFVHDLWDQSYFFFTPPEEYDAKLVGKKWTEDSPVILRDLKEILSQLEPFRAEAIKDSIHKFSDEKGLSIGQIMLPLRISLVGTGMGPDVAKIVELIGKEETIKRIERAASEIRN
jgi:glutamyl-tRNA synthetase